MRTCTVSFCPARSFAGASGSVSCALKAASGRGPGVLAGAGVAAVLAVGVERLHPAASSAHANTRKKSFVSPILNRSSPFMTSTLVGRAGRYRGRYRLRLDLHVHAQRLRPLLV